MADKTTDLFANNGIIRKALVACETHASHNIRISYFTTCLDPKPTKFVKLFRLSNLRQHKECLGDILGISLRYPLEICTVWNTTTISYFSALEDF